MGRVILDTTVLVDVERGKGTLADQVSAADDVAIAAITAAELQVGVELADGRRRARRQDFVSAVLEVLPIETYNLDTATAHAKLLAHTGRMGEPRGAHDLVIAATALATGRAVITADRAAFAALPGVQLSPSW